MKKHGHKFFDTGEFNLNIIGVRSADKDSNAFNDVLCVLFMVHGKEVLHIFKASTDPGLFWRENPLNVNGCAVMVPDQYPGLWRIDKHRNYFALVQNKPCAVYRDNDFNSQLDITDDTPIQTGKFGINGHRANGDFESTQVDKWSAGCQVIADPLEFNLLMALCEISRKRYGNSFTYTLLLEQDL